MLEVERNVKVDRKFHHFYSPSLWCLFTYQQHNESEYSCWWGDSINFWILRVPNTSKMPKEMTVISYLLDITWQCRDYETQNIIFASKSNKGKKAGGVGWGRKIISTEGDWIDSHLHCPWTQCQSDNMISQLKPIHNQNCNLIKNTSKISNLLLKKSLLFLWD